MLMFPVIAAHDLSDHTLADAIGDCVNLSLSSHPAPVYASDQMSIIHRDLGAPVPLCTGEVEMPSLSRISNIVSAGAWDDMVRIYAALVVAKVPRIHVFRH